MVDSFDNEIIDI